MSHQSDMTAPRAIGLPDARTLSYAEYGGPAGAPILFFHGFPASHKEAALWHEAAVRHSARLIAPDRPGIGLSSYHSGRRFLHWPSDVAHLTRQLRIDACHILATAGGSPYALACLHEFRRDSSAGEEPSTNLTVRIKGTAIVSGIYPLSLPGPGPSGIQLSTRIALWIVGHIWFLIVPLLEWFMGTPARQNPQLFMSRMMREAESRPIVDKMCLADKAYGSGFIESTKHVFARDARGAAYEAGLMGRPWGFELDDIDAGGVSIWQGGFDAACPVAMARRAHGHLKGSILKVFEYEGHLSLPARRQDEILKAMIYG
ncbi:Alpha/Beta hydrolase protein [Diplogelasinospora grovesii]|uniref:Alpha/Beta hydrolase protein n=1 Tax=Diplogelasinospora grovesii TaxID=303347 RepID=A0AAN6NIA4_9PEZI|nr:Alpha/Beta hydrolase protein [Diplogelasinospora grovesii]